MCAGTVAEVIQSVVNGADGCVFCFGHSKLGNTRTPRAHTHTHEKATKSVRVSLVSHTVCLCVSLFLGCLFAGPLLSEGERRGLVSADAESVLRLLLLCFRLDLFNPAKAASLEKLP